MARYLRIYWAMIRFSCSRAMEFRMDFWFRIVMDCAFYASNIAFFKAVYLHTPQIGGWDESQAMVFVAAFLLIDAIHMVLFSNNLYVLPMLINKGDLDYYLVRPVSALFFVSLRDFALNSAVNLLIAAGIWIVAVWNLPVLPGIFEFAAHFIGLCLGSSLMYMLRIVAIAPVFWTHSGRGFDQLYISTNVVSERPDRIFRGWTRRILLSVFPYGLMASFPTRLLVDPWGGSWPLVMIGHMAIVTLLFALFIRWFWGRGLKAYSSASS